MPRAVEDRSDVGGAAQFNNIRPVPLSASCPAFRFTLSQPSLRFIARFPSRDSRNPQVAAGLLVALFQIERDHEVCA